METKPWYESKLTWLGILQVGIAFGTLLSEFLTKGIYDPASITLLVTGLLTIIIRVFFTSQPIQL
jgi:hypothetical protein